jgi:predicted dehydrogenase
MSFSNLTRRSALQKTALLGLATAIHPLRAANTPSKKLRVAVVGLGRGMGHVSALLSLPDVEIGWLAEVDPKRLANGMKVVTAKQGEGCRGVVDFRQALEDKTLDAVFIALPNFWHTPAALLAMQAGKHVYVEKPGSQNPAEAEMIVAAARKYGRVVQMGNQRRTYMRDGIALLHSGEIGEVRFARAFYYASRKAIGSGALAAGADLDFNLWQGPVPDERDMRSFVHYDWHWLWHWGNGELGNNGIHYLDVLRWGLKVRYPKRVTYNGGRYWFSDSQETPDTGTAVFDFGKVGMEWVQSSCVPRPAEKPVGECVFYGDNGSMVLAGPNWTVYDPKGLKVKEGSSTGGKDAAHIGNFLGAIRGEATLNSPINEAQISTMLCHLGNIAYRTNTVLECDSETGRIANNPAAAKLWGRTYRPGWEPKV